MGMVPKTWGSGYYPETEIIQDDDNWEFVRDGDDKDGEGGDDEQLM